MFAPNFLKTTTVALGPASACRGVTELGYHVDRTGQLTAFVSTTRFKFIHDDVESSIARIDVNGLSQPVLVLSYSDFVGWVRFEGGNAVWRYGSLRTGRASMPQLVGDLNRDEGAVVVDAISYAIREVGPEWPPVGTADCEPEEFIQNVESNRTPRPWSKAIAEIGTAIPRKEVTAPAPAPPPTPHVEFNPYLHTRERHPAAPGVTEDQLNDVPLVTVHPATVPAVIGALFLFLAILGGPYELFVVMRWAVTSMAIWMAIVAGGQKRTPWVVVFAAIALLFNPIIPFYATREFWVPIDFAGLVFFWAAGVNLRASKPAPPNLSRSF